MIIRLIIMMIKGTGFVVGSVGNAIAGTAIGATYIAEECKKKKKKD